MQLNVLRLSLFLWMLFAGVAVASAQYSDWSTPVNLGPVVNSTFTEETPFLSRDGLQLFFSSDRPGGYGGSDLWVVSRSRIGSPWGPPVNLGPNINTPDNESHPTLSVDGHALYFDRTMPSDGGTFDMFRARRHNKFDDSGWSTAINLGPCINTPANDSAMIFFEDEETGATYTYFNSNRSGNPNFYATIFDPEGPCTPVTLVDDLNTPYAERNATISHEGLEIFFESNRPGSLSFDIWTATRASTSDHWSIPVNVGGLNSASYDGRPAFSWNGTELYFFSNRGGDFDLYVSTRTQLKSRKGDFGR